MIDFSSIARASRIGKALRALLPLIPPDRDVPILQGPLRMTRWVVGSAVHGCWLGSYEREKQRVFERVLKPGDVVFDIGANVGFYTLLASRLVGSRGSVVAFEPISRNLGYLRRHLELNRVTNVKVLETAIGAISGTINFDASPNFSSGRIDAAGAITVPVTTLDALDAANSIAAVHLIKLDVEGAEYDVLVGGSAFIRRTRPIIVIATHGADVHLRCLSLLEDMAYDVSSLDTRCVQDTDELVAMPRLVQP